MTFDLINWLNQQSGGSQLPLTLSNLNGLGSSAIAQESREWLVTNGLGSYASGSITGANTRRYHGLFVASLTPPVRRTVLFSRLDETLAVGEDANAHRYELATNFWQSGNVAPQGYKLLEQFSDLPTPTWCFRVPGGRLLKQVFMKDGEQRFMSAIPGWRTTARAAPPSTWLYCSTSAIFIRRHAVPMTGILARSRQTKNPSPSSLLPARRP